jgi:hypothetical protein
MERYTAPVVAFNVELVGPTVNRAVTDVPVPGALVTVPAPSVAVPAVTHICGVERVVASPVLDLEVDRLRRLQGVVEPPDLVAPERLRWWAG